MLSLCANARALSARASSVGVWLFCYLILRGVKEAAAINRIATVAKVVPIVVFILIAVVAFKGGVFADNFWGGDDPSFSSVFEQAKGGTLFINSSIVSDDIGRDDVKLVKAPVTEMALEMGNAKVLNVIMLGVYVGYTEVVPPEVVWSTIEHKMAKKPKLLPLNKEAFEKGLAIGREQK